MKKILLLVLLCFFVACSNDDENLEEIGIIKYVVETSRTEAFVEYFDETQTEKRDYLDQSLVWEYSFEGRRGDVASVLLTNDSTSGSSATIYIYFNDEKILGKGCSSNWVLNCLGVVKVP